MKCAGTKDQNLKASRASTQHTCVYSWACPNHLLEFAVSGHLAKAFAIYVLPARALGGKTESCRTKSSVLRDRLTFEGWYYFTCGPHSLQVNQNTCEVLVQVQYEYYRSQLPGTTHASLRTTTTFFINHSPLLLLFNNYASSWPRSHQDWNWHVDVTLLFYRGLSHAKSKLKQSKSRVYHLLSIQLLRYAELYQSPVWY